MRQSSGKSSVLESVVGKDFLPRGSGTVISRFQSSEKALVPEALLYNFVMLLMI